jgi:hypothetical protein
MNLICGINPVLEALAAGTRHFDRLLVVKGLRTKRLSEATGSRGRSVEGEQRGLEVSCGIVCLEEPGGGGDGVAGVVDVHDAVVEIGRASCRERV